MMTTDQIWREYKANKRLSGLAIRVLRKMLGEASSPFDVISLAGDTGALQAAPEIAIFLNNDDVMVRWIAAAVLFGRFRDVRYASDCLRMISTEQDTMVHIVCLTGCGELLPLLDDKQLIKSLSEKLLTAYRSNESLPEVRAAAYEGMEAAVGVPPLERRPVGQVSDSDACLDQNVVSTFARIYT